MTIISVTLKYAIAILVITSLTAFCTRASPGVSSHVLDQTNGVPAPDVLLTLYRQNNGTKQFDLLSSKRTNADGRVDDFISEPQFTSGTYKINFDVGPYFESHDLSYFYPYIEIVFLVKDEKQHYHVPCLLSPFGYSTYRGS